MRRCPEDLYTCATAYRLFIACSVSSTCKTCQHVAARAEPGAVEFEGDALWLALLGLPTCVSTAIEHLVFAVLLAHGRRNLRSRNGGQRVLTWDASGISKESEQGRDKIHLSRALVSNMGIAAAAFRHPPCPRTLVFLHPAISDTAIVWAPEGL